MESIAPTSATAVSARQSAHAGCEPALCATRRTVLMGGAGLVGAAALAGCGSGSKSAAATSAPTTSASTSSAPASSAAAPAALAKVSDIPVGSAISAKDANGRAIILAQPTAGVVKGFSAICTHQGCTVAPKGNELDCPCHGSRYDASTGAVLGGPAPAPLNAFAVKVVDGSVVPA